MTIKEMMTTEMDFTGIDQATYERELSEDIEAMEAREAMEAGSIESEEDLADFEAAVGRMSDQELLRTSQTYVDRSSEHFGELILLAEIAHRFKRKLGLDD